MVAGLTITASASFAHDVYASVIKKGDVPPNGEVRVARITAVVIGAVSIGLGILALQAGLNIAFLVALAFAVAASANLPTIIYTLFWKRFTTQGALWSIYGGLIICIGLIVFSPVVSGGGDVDVPRRRLRLVPAEEPGPGLHPGVVPARLARHGGLEGRAGRGQVGRARGARAHRHRGGEGRPPLKMLISPAPHPAQAQLASGTVSRRCAHVARLITSHARR